MADNDSVSVASSAPAANKRMEHMKKLKDANSKNKELLKLAKERIQSQEEELDRMSCKFMISPMFCVSTLALCSPADLLTFATIYSRSETSGREKLFKSPW